MYGWLWRHLPGHWLPQGAHPITDRWPARSVQMLALAAGVVALLMYVVFPWADPKLPFNDNTIDQPSGAVTPAPSVSPTTAPTTSAPVTSPTATPTGPTTSISIPSGELPGD